MLLFRSEQHASRWCQQWDRPIGGTLSLQQGWELARLWYSDRLDANWRPRTAPEAQKLFTDIGLRGDFWQLAD